MAEPYYQDDLVTLYHGSLFDVLPGLGHFDACIADPPYGQTSIAWDRWPTGWASRIAEHTDSLWCFGTLRMFLTQASEFVDWKFAQDVVWHKTRATSVVTDRFRRQHELVAHYYRGTWAAVPKALPKRPTRPEVQNHTRGRVNRPVSSHQSGTRVYGGYSNPSTWVDDGMRYMTSVISAAAMSTKARFYAADKVNPTQKPIDLLEPLIEYSVPAGGIVLDPFGGSGSTAIAARNLGRRCVLIEVREEQCEITARRLAQPCTPSLDLWKIGG